MKKPGIIDGVALAAVVSLGGGALNFLFGGIFGAGNSFNAVLLAATLVYLLFLLRRSGIRVGRVAVIALWALASLLGWLFDLLLLEQLLIQAAFIWLVRSLYYHGSLFPAALDFGLVAAGLAAGTWAMVNTSSPSAALWSFFLVQALFPWIPDLARREDGVDGGAAPGRGSFQSAHRVARDAVRKLSQP